MILFQSLASVQLYTLAAVAALLWFGAGRQPLVPVYRFARALVTSRRSLLFFLATLAILGVNTYEVRLEEAFGVRYDLTQALVGWEGAWHAWLQHRLQSGWLTAVTVFFYVIMFQAVMLASLGIYASRENKRMYYAFCAALLLTYAAALPLYWFVPVNEAWFAHPDIRFLMTDAFPTFDRDYRGLSGINNCFPSLHTSISVLMAILASRSGVRRWAVLAWINALVIIFAIFYLGIHWFTDMAAGVLLAAGSAYLGLRIGDWAAGTRAAAKPAESSPAQKASPTG